MIIEPKYDSVDFFHNGKTRVTINGKSEIIDKSGKIKKLAWLLEFIDDLI